MEARGSIKWPIFNRNTRDWSVWQPSFQLSMCPFIFMWSIEVSRTYSRSHRSDRYNLYPDHEKRCYLSPSSPLTNHCSHGHSLLFWLLTPWIIFAWFELYVNGIIVWNFWLHVEPWIHFHFLCSSVTRPFFTHSTGNRPFSSLQFETISTCVAMIKLVNVSWWIYAYIFCLHLSSEL